MELMRCSFFADYPFRWPSCAARYLRPRRVSDGIYARKSFRRGRQAGVLLVSKSSGPCGSAVFRLGVSFALVGVGGGGIVRIRVWISRQGARFVHIGARFVRIGARFVRIGARFVHEFRGIGADWGVWEAPSPRFSPFPLSAFCHCACGYSV